MRGICSSALLIRFIHTGLDNRCDEECYIAQHPRSSYQSNVPIGHIALRKSGPPTTTYANPSDYCILVHTNAWRTKDGLMKHLHTLLPSRLRILCRLTEDGRSRCVGTIKTLWHLLPARLRRGRGEAPPPTPRQKKRLGHYSPQCHEGGIYLLVPALRRAPPASVSFHSNRIRQGSTPLVQKRRKPIRSSHVAHPDVRVKHGVQIRVFVGRSPAQFSHDDDEGEEADHPY